MSHHYSGPDFGFPHGDARLDLTDLYQELSDQDPWAQLRSPMDMMVHGWASSLFQASQQ